jgi:hypothetical protein
MIPPIHIEYYLILTFYPILPTTHTRKFFKNYVWINPKSDKCKGPAYDLRR